MVKPKTNSDITQFDYTAFKQELKLAREVFRNVANQIYNVTEPGKNTIAENFDYAKVLKPYLDLSKEQVKLMLLNAYLLNGKKRHYPDPETGNKDYWVVHNLETGFFANKFIDNSDVKEETINRILTHELVDVVCEHNVKTYNDLKKTFDTNMNQLLLDAILLGGIKYQDPILKNNDTKWNLNSDGAKRIFSTEMVLTYGNLPTFYAYILDKLDNIFSPSENMLGDGTKPHTLSKIPELIYANNALRKVVEPYFSNQIQLVALNVAEENNMDFFDILEELDALDKMEIDLREESKEQRKAHLKKFDFFAGQKEDEQIKKKRTFREVISLGLL